MGAIFAGMVNLEPLLHLLGAHVEIAGAENGNIWGTWLSGTVAHFDADVGGLSYLAAGGGTLAMLTGIGLAYVWYGKEGRMPMARVHGFAKVLMNKWYVDEFYDATIVRGSKALAVFAAAVDKYLIDGILARASALGVSLVSWISTRPQNGVIHTYAAVMVLGLAAIGWWFTHPHTSLDGVATRSDVTWTSGRGLGYEYRWDIDDDGEADTEWSAEGNSASHTYDHDDWVGYALIFDGSRPGEEAEEVFLDDSIVVLTESDIGRGWEADPEGGTTPPSFRVEGDEVVFLKNDARARARGGDAEAEERLHPGDTVQVGALNVRVGAVVRATLEVRNSFGNVTRETSEVVIQPAPRTREVAALRAAPATQGGAR
ncbi:MAG: hypothetical protein JRH11_26220 [Deltaproteobacteria bacterium]|nr:hypothetical protein [Deltaproteobacteria bacterium]